MQLQIAVWLAN